MKRPTAKQSRTRNDRNTTTKDTNFTFYSLLRHVCFELQKPTCGDTTPSTLLMHPQNGPRSRIYSTLYTLKRRGDTARASYLFSSHSLSGWVKNVQCNPLKCRYRRLRLPGPDHAVEFLPVAFTTGAGSVAPHCACAENNGPDPFKYSDNIML